jgi:cobyrinic acid a,c-diamide synthase
MTSRLTLGYREATAATASILAAPGDVVRAHEFHRTESDPPSGPTPAWLLDPPRREGHVTSNVHASYLHVHWAGYPQCAARFAAACRAAVPVGSQP